MQCPCGSGKAFANCCERFLSGAENPQTAEELMRSRYTAFTRADMEYIKKTLAGEAKRSFDLTEAKKWATQAKWLGLEILSVRAGGPEDKKGKVEFVATYEQKGEGIEHHEVATFRKNDEGRWMFVDGDSHTHKAGEGHQHHHHPKPQTVQRDSPKVGRNDPCPCGSGKKYKKCCGA